MNIFRYLLGPELIWFLAYAGSKILGRMNHQQQGRFDAFIENKTMLMPLLLVTLCMLLYKIDMVPQRFLFLRIALSSVFIGHFFMEAWANAFSRQGPGSGTMYMVGILEILIFVAIAFVIHFFIRK
ncbi:MAG TPA: hypothetical protein VFX48_04645 [Saprospiraceae bacterium]|nr:hypothetical protein [Saprospiraceae bacterium]